MLMWNPWHGCHKFSEGCLNCYVYHQDKQYGVDTSIINKSKSNFDTTIKRTRAGSYKIESGSIINTCMTSDFFIEEADIWREEAWQIIKSRPDCAFVIPTKRIHRFKECIPSDWGEIGYTNVVIALTCENQTQANKRMPIFIDLPIQTKLVYVAPILEYVDLTEWLYKHKIKEVSVGGESYNGARPCNFDWVIQIYKDCRQYETKFNFYQTGSNFIMNNKLYKIPRDKEHEQSDKAMKYLENTHK